MEVFLKKHFWVFHLIVAGLLGLFLARAAAHVLEASFLPEKGELKPAWRRPLPPPPPPPSKDEMVILKRNVFCSTCPPIVPAPESVDAPKPTGPVKTSMPLRLVVTAVSSDPRWSVAVLCDTTTRECGAFGLSMKIKQGTLIGIAEKKVEFDVDGHIEFLEFDGAPAGPATASLAPATDVVTTTSSDNDPLAKDLDKGVRKVSENDYRLSRDLLEKVLGDTSTLARSARIVPNIVDGKPNGFKLFAIRPGSVYARIGLQNGDAVHAINGYDMSSPDKALEVYTKLRRANHLSVSLTRHGQSMTMDYTIQ